MKKKQMLLLLGLLSVSMLLSACAPAAPAVPGGPAIDPVPTLPAEQKETDMPKAEYKKLSAQDAKARIDSGDALIILDVREDDEFAAGHIPGAVLLPVGQITSRAGDVLPDKDAEILLYCRSGNRSRTAAMQLIELGYTNVHDFGGIISWPYETVKESP